MRFSKFAIKSKRFTKDEIDKSTSRLISGNFISQESSGIFAFMPLGTRVLNKIINLIKIEHEKVGFMECILPNLQTESLWEKSGRAEQYGDEFFKLIDRKKKPFLLAPTAEESSLRVMEETFNSYGDLPLTIFQIQKKYRDDLRPRFGLVRCKEFIMKDAYSFCSKSEEQEKIYLEFFNLYIRIFKLLELDVFPAEAETGEVGGKFSHEFVIPSPLGESKVYLENLEDIFREEIDHIKDLNKVNASFLSEKKELIKVMELGHIFYLDTKYSQNMDLGFLDRDGSKKPYIMGCFGIGVSRLLSCLAEKKYWPSIVSPFDIHIIDLNHADAQWLYDQIKSLGIDPLWDDRTDKSFGVKIEDAELIGIPFKIILGNSYEFLNKDVKHSFKNKDELFQFVKNFFNNIN